MKTILLAAAAMALPAVLAACQNLDLRDEPEDFMGYQGDPRLGEPVGRICFTREISGFGETTQDTVIVEAGANDSYLVKTFGRCADLEHADSMALDQFGASCLTEGDSIIPYDTAFGPDAVGLPPRGCMIDEIYRWRPDRDAE
ncbi:hypothetical protein E5163_02145 [Marinicauda algicola]|uniref:Lipoprotein n=1 Tax=Marinicauda algicola TaxID=2029849 RepID=A0A4V3RYE3_9PROT|nr:DUF6491 family protein [Marinicauda algicola]TGY89959.1 hypothetical protein E5163_02145 [Marinicauda algicola]